jgi:large subunit ribosomal protein L30
MADTVKGQEQAAAKAAPRARKAGGATLRIKQIGSLIGCTDRQRATVRGLGLRRMHHVVERQDTPEIRGMVKAVPHLVAVVE